MISKDARSLLDYLKALLNDAGTKPDLTTEIVNDEEFSNLDQTIKAIREATVELGKGNLSYPIEGKGYVLGSLKALQASLRNLTWKTKAIAAGDFSQSVHFLGDFSDAFNSMTKKLETSTKKLQESEELHRLLADNAADVIWTMDLEGRFTYVSPSVEKLRGYTVEEVMAQSPQEMLSPSSLIHLQQGLERAIHSVQNNQPFQVFRGELEQPCKDGRTVWTEATVSGIYSEDGRFVGMLGVTRDITERKVMADEILRLSITDKLTQSYNRLKLDETLDEQLMQFKINALPFSIIMLDIDHFKRVNDTYGHQVGDRVLVELVAILTEHVRGDDVVGRWGGEEFLIILPNTKLDDAFELAERLRSLVETYQFTSTGRVTISLGVSAYRDDSTPESIVSRADTALYQAKENGRNRVEYLK